MAAGVAFVRIGVGIGVGAEVHAEKKSYYMDGHDRANVLEYRDTWLSLELKYELRQYLLVQMPLKKATAMEVTVDGKNRSLFDALLMSTVANGAEESADRKEDEAGGAVDGAEGGEDTKAARKAAAKLKSVTVLAKSFANEMMFHYS